MGRTVKEAAQIQNLWSLKSCVVKNRTLTQKGENWREFERGLVPLLFEAREQNLRCALQLPEQVNDPVPTRHVASPHVGCSRGSFSQ